MIVLLLPKFSKNYESNFGSLASSYIAPIISTREFVVYRNLLMIIHVLAF